MARSFSCTQKKTLINQKQQKGLSMKKKALQGATCREPHTFHWRSCSSQQELSSLALEKPVSVMVHNLTLTLSSMDPFKQHCQDLLPGSTTSQKQLLSYTTISPINSSRLYSLFHLLCRTSPTHLPAHCLALFLQTVSMMYRQQHLHLLRYGEGEMMCRGHPLCTDLPIPSLACVVMPLCAAPYMTKLNLIFT